MEKLIERLEILKSGGILSQANYDLVCRLMDILHKEHGLILNEKNAGMFITHFSQALERISKNEAVDSVDEAVYSAVLLSPFFEEASQIGEKAVALAPNLPESEKKYIIIHACVLLENQ